MNDSGVRERDEREAVMSPVVLPGRVEGTAPRPCLATGSDLILAQGVLT